MLEVQALHVSYGTVHAVQGIDLYVQSGEAVGLLGPNAAGKSTTLRAISQLVGYQGTIRFDGKLLSRTRPDAVARLGLIHVPEGRHILLNLSMHENLQVGLSARSGRASPFTVADVYDLFPPLGALHRRPGWALSGGEQQMTAIGRALVAAPRLLMLDEPSLGLAPVMARAVYEALREIKTRVPMLLIEQNTAMALELCDRAHIISGGRIQLSGTSAELANREALMASYLGRRKPVADQITGETKPTHQGGRGY
jgi:branched-chain amino acid transport system ATP-binding protein